QDQSGFQGRSTARPPVRAGGGAGEDFCHYARDLVDREDITATSRGSDHGSYLEGAGTHGAAGACGHRAIRRRESSFVRESIFSTFSRYIKDVYWAFRSVVGSCATALPYLFGIGEFRREVTEQYPDPISSRTEDDLPPRTRGLIHNDIDRCTGCGDCKQVCPVSCIDIENEPGPDVKKNWGAVFTVDFS